MYVCQHLILLHRYTQITTLWVLKYSVSAWLPNPILPDGRRYEQCVTKVNHAVNTVGGDSRATTVGGPMMKA